MPYYQDDTVTLHHGDALDVGRQLEPGSADCIVTSPPYFGLRDYGVDGQIGNELTPTHYIGRLAFIFDELHRVLADDGTMWVNLGDSYEPSKNLRLMPARLAFALQGMGWILRNDAIWAKQNGMPESVTDRLTNRHEHLMLFVKNRSYHFDLDAIREQYDGDRPLSRRSRSGATNKENSIAKPWGRPEATPPGSAPQSNFGPSGERNGKFHPQGRNPGDVWSIATQPFPGAHFATMPVALAERCVMAGCKPGGTVLDPFSGSGTTGLAAARHGRRYVGIDLNRSYLDLSLSTRLAQGGLDLSGAPSS
ncbi:site-specific DNA-methyltransferase [Rhodococcus sp. 05-2255-3B1]|uniref:DNA-methyltransferase n=1 Tax=unclassified Rhodococcus (in: high G+C Gram-positive bacteria) TaxID=192944 RepID=UPI000B9A4EB3|nr:MULTISPECIES: site-specific DNA-methyltransferase [unclassified Rhodococcus (in: high G+C Gram-positive bacteria)]OZE13355.1 site-specific DNA-methyltransferase [Rhodococcus sp. 05-2255-3C]OZE16033.1 site-specific DNA-methyltransferase [Rhodococcus sp. 05-2255-3B1]OZE19073.1 site-specific DNA-methyltransferase [Rhodococcus sp. 05-2255-2A2]